MSAPGSRRKKSLAVVDEMPAPLRRCVHEYGSPIVNVCVKFGVKSPRHIDEIVREIWDGARNPNTRMNARGEASANIIHDKLDWLLMQAGASTSAKTLVRFLWERGFVIVTREPGQAAIDASMSTVSNFDMRVTKERKHLLRLRAAIAAQAKALWPSLFLEDAA